MDSRLKDREKPAVFFRGVGVPTCRPRGVELEVEPARNRVLAHVPPDRRPSAPGAVPDPHASRASPGRIGALLGGRDVGLTLRHFFALSIKC